MYVLKAPPLLPSETLPRVLRLARANGTMVLVIAGLCALFAAAGHDILGTVIGLLVAGSGAVELHGATLIRGSEGRGMNWLVASQLCLWALILGYVLFEMLRGGFGLMFPPEVVELYAERLGTTVASVRESFSTIMGISLAIGTTAYQGGLTLYYVRRRAAVQAALHDR